MTPFKALGAITLTLLYIVISLCMVPFAAGIWALTGIVHGMEWARERVA